MTRKRFVKLLMARGYDRDEANERALEVVESGGSYERAYTEIVISFKVLDMLPDFVAYISRCIYAFTAALPNIVQAISRMVEATAKFVAKQDPELLAKALRNGQT